MMTFTCVVCKSAFTLTPGEGLRCHVSALPSPDEGCVCPACAAKHDAEWQEAHKNDPPNVDLIDCDFCGTKFGHPGFSAFPCPGCGLEYQFVECLMPDTEQLIRKAEEREREACAEVANEMDAWGVETAILARGVKEPTS